jgi:putative hydrolase of the HAD superfamily
MRTSSRSSPDPTEPAQREGLRWRWVRHGTAEEQPITGAVIFDYFGTLTVATPAATRRAGTARVAAALGVPSDILFEATTSTFTERSTGRCGDMLATMAWLADRCGHRPDAAQLESACGVRFEIECGYARMLRDDALVTLQALREEGLRIGVVSDCTHELRDIWDHLPLAPLVDAVAFSITMGERKPHASLYLSVCDRLGIDPPEAIYLGDGGSNELTGARHVGMSAVRLVAEDAADALVYDREPDWGGPVVHSLTEFASALVSCDRHRPPGW